MNLNEEIFDKTLSDLVFDNAKKYREHISKGGDPVKLTLVLHPWEDEGMQWKIYAKIPEEIKTLVAVLQFTLLIKEQIMEAISPDATIPNPDIPFGKTSMGREGGGGG